MRWTPSLLVVLALAGAARADTLQEVTTHGMVVTMQGVDYDLTFASDGSFKDTTGQVAGTWVIRGDSLCTTSNNDPKETCFAYPRGKKSGDVFQITAPEGVGTIRIK